MYNHFTETTYAVVVLVLCLKLGLVKWC